VLVGVLAPAGTPREIAEKLNAEVVRVVRLPDIREKLDAMGVEPSATPPSRWPNGSGARSRSTVQ